MTSSSSRIGGWCGSASIQSVTAITVYFRARQSCARAMTDAALLFLQLTCILAACRVVGWLASRVGQPRVVAEMVTGFLLGPSFAGRLAPAIHASLFPADLPAPSDSSARSGSSSTCSASGSSFACDLVVHAGRRAVGLSIAGIVGPFVLGGARRFMIRAGRLLHRRVTPVQAALFLGTALSITAFPVLARIISERGHRRHDHRLAGALGRRDRRCGRVDDAGGGPRHVHRERLAGDRRRVWRHRLRVHCRGGLQPLWRRLAAIAERHDRVSSSLLAGVLACADVQRLVHGNDWHPCRLRRVHARRQPSARILTRELRHLIEPLTSSLFVPLFFVYAGLRTELSLVNSATLWGDRPARLRRSVCRQRPCPAGSARV